MSQQWKISIAAQVAQDASGRAYPSYLIPEPVSFRKWRDGIDGLKLVPRSEIGANPDVAPPDKYKTIELVRGGQPIDLEVCDEQLIMLRSDKKNLLIFNVEKVGAPTPAPAPVELPADEPRATTKVSYKGR